MFIAMNTAENLEKIIAIVKQKRSNDFKKGYEFIVTTIERLGLPELEDLIREKILTCIANEPVEIAYIVLDKEHVNPVRHNHKQKIYNFIVVISCAAFHMEILLIEMSRDFLDS